MAQKIAFITGGNRGLGFQTALDLKDPGVKVVIGSRPVSYTHLDVYKRQVVEVAAELLLRNHRAQVAVGGRNEPNVHWDRLIPAQPLDLPLL